MPPARSTHIGLPLDITLGLVGERACDHPPPGLDQAQLGREAHHQQLPKLLQAMSLCVSLPINMGGPRPTQRALAFRVQLYTGAGEIVVIRRFSACMQMETEAQIATGCGYEGRGATGQEHPHRPSS